MNDKLRPCPFCGNEIKIIVCDDEGNTYEPSYDETYIPINYCPMCGAKLKEAKE